MADISQITLPSGSTYNLKDAWARNQISTITGTAALTFKGVSSTPLTDGGTATPTLDGTVVPIADLGVGDIYFYNSGEYIWGPNPNYVEGGSAPQNVWHELGNLSGLGGLAYKNNATASYQPAGTISKPTFSGSTLTMSTSYTPAGNVTVSVTSSSSKKYAVSKVTSGGGAYQPEGTVSAPTFTGTLATISMSTSYTPAGTVKFTTQDKTLGISATTSSSGNYRPAGTVSSVGITVSAAGATTSINNPTAKQVASAVTVAAPGATAPANNLTYYSVSNETLSLYQIGYSTTASITTSSVTVKTGDATYKMNGVPTFSGTTAQLDVDSFTLPMSASFTGTGATITASTHYTPAGTNTEPTFTGTTAQLATADISIPDTFGGTFTGLASTITVSGTPAGSVSQPIFTGTTTDITVS